MKYAFAPGFGGKLPGVLSLMRALLEKKTGMQYIEGILRHMFHTVEGMGKEERKAMVEENLSAEKGELIERVPESGSLHEMVDWLKAAGQSSMLLT